jgi:hypothetical protein
MNEPRLMTKEEQSELAALSADVLWTDEDALGLALAGF